MQDFFKRKFYCYPKGTSYFSKYFPSITVQKRLDCSKIEINFLLYVIPMFNSFFSNVCKRLWIQIPYLLIASIANILGSIHEVLITLFVSVVFFYKDVVRFMSLQYQSMTVIYFFFWIIKCIPFISLVYAFTSIQYSSPPS